jgi:hypothetical protein
VEHRGIEFQIVQTASPTGFRWTVELDAKHTRSGTSYSKGNAMFRAVCVINEVMRKRLKTDAASDASKQQS